MVALGFGTTNRFFRSKSRELRDKPSELLAAMISARSGSYEAAQSLVFDALGMLMVLCELSRFQVPS
jgi:hypothetical protein